MWLSGYVAAAWKRINYQSLTHGPVFEPCHRRGSHHIYIKGPSILFMSWSRVVMFLISPIFRFLLNFYRILDYWPLHLSKHLRSSRWCRRQKVIICRPEWRTIFRDFNLFCKPRLRHHSRTIANRLISITCSSNTLNRTISIRTKLRVVIFWFMSGNGTKLYVGILLGIGEWRCWCNWPPSSGKLHLRHRSIMDINANGQK